MEKMIFGLRMNKSVPAGECRKAIAWAKHRGRQSIVDKRAARCTWFCVGRGEGHTTWASAPTLSSSVT